VAVTSVAVTGGNPRTEYFSLATGFDTCTGVNLAPGQSCTVGVNYTNVTGAFNTTYSGTITFHDTASGNPQSAVLQGTALP